jgi:hypothetical protein
MSNETISKSEALIAVLAFRAIAGDGGFSNDELLDSVGRWSKIRGKTALGTQGDEKNAESYIDAADACREVLDKWHTQQIRIRTLHANAGLNAAELYEAASRLVGAIGEYDILVDAAGFESALIATRNVLRKIGNF